MKKNFFLVAFLLLFLTNFYAVDMLVTGIGRLPPVTIPLEYNDDFFKQDSHAYNHKIARLACLLSDVAYTDCASEKLTSDNALLQDYERLGFSHESIEFTYDINYNDAIYGNDQAAFSIAAKTTGYGTLLFLVVRGTPIGADEWFSNLNIANTQKTGRIFHEGFARAATMVHSALVSYLLRHRIDPASTYLLITGHSRGAAIANLLGASIFYNDKFFDDKHVFVYTFACPNTIAGVKESEVNTEQYSFINNIINPEDIVPMVPLTGKGWNFTKFGTTHALVSFWNCGQERFYRQILPSVRAYSNILIRRDYVPFWAGSFYPNQITDIVKVFAPTVKKYYKRNTGLHSQAALMMKKMFTPNSDLSMASEDSEIKEITSDNEQGKSKKAKRPKNIILRIFATWVNGIHEDAFKYVMLAFNDMHACETYLSFMLGLGEDEVFSDNGYTAIVIDGPAEGVVVGEDGKMLLRISNGNAEYKTMDSLISAFSLFSSKVTVGFPNNLNFVLYLTNESLINTPIKLTVKKFDACGTLIETGRATKVFPRVELAYKILAGSSTYNNTTLQVQKLNRKTSRKLTKDYKMRPEQQFSVLSTVDIDTDANINFGVEVGCQAIYALTKMGFNMDRPSSVCSITAGIGSRQTLISSMYLDFNAMNKFIWVFWDKDAGEYTFNVVPEIQLALGVKPLSFLSMYVGCLLDFQVAGFNDGAFNGDIRHSTFGRGPIGGGDYIAPALTFGIRLF